MYTPPPPPDTLLPVPQDSHDHRLPPHVYIFILPTGKHDWCLLHNRILARCKPAAEMG